MKKLLFVLAFLFGSHFVAAQCTSTTPNLGLLVPAFNCPNWNTSVNSNFFQLDTIIPAIQAGVTPFGTFAARPGVCTAGSLYVATDKTPGFNILTCGAGNVWYFPAFGWIYTVGTLPTGVAPGYLVSVTDGFSSSNYCTVGGGIIIGLCQWTGTVWQPVSSSGGTPSFGVVTPGTNTGALVMGSGGSLTFSGTGTINANLINATRLSSLATGPLCNTSGTGVPFICLVSSFPTLNQNTTGTAAAFTGTPTTCGAGVATTGITANGTPVGCFTPTGTLNGMVAGEPAIGQSATSAIASPSYVDAYALNQANGGTWDICESISQAFLSFSNKQGTVDARGFTGNQGCTVATATGSATNGMIPGANCQNTTQGGGTCNGQIISRGRILLSNTLTWFLPVVSTEAGNTSGSAGSKVNYDRIGTVVIPFGVTIEGIGNSAAGSQGGQTQIIACQSAGYLGVTNCPAPATTEIYQITSITVTQQTAAPGRQYAHIVTATQSDIVGGQPFRISGAVASGNVTMVDFNNSYTACESSAYSDVVTDPSCGGGSGGQSTTGAADIYMPVNSGITSLTVTSIGSGYGSTPPTCSLPAPANSGGVQATCIATVSSGSVSGLYVVNRGTGYASGQATGTVTLSGNATATFQTIPSSCTRGTNVSCGYLYGQLPLLHMIGFNNGISSSTTLGVGVSMGDHLLNVNIDCKFVPTCVAVSSRSVQENSQIKDNWFGNSPDRDVDFHGFQTQNSDALNGNRETLTSLNNRQKAVAAGAYTFGSGTLSLTTGSQAFVQYGVYYVFGSPANIGCAKSVNSTTLPTYPTYIPMVATSVTGTSVVLDDSGTGCATSGSGTDTYTVGEICEPGMEIIYLGDVGPHGIQDNTADYSNCVNSGSFPVAYNAALRINTNSTQAPYLMGGHAEGAIYGILAGDSQAFRGMSLMSWAGIPTPNMGSFGNNNQAGGQYQSEIGSSAIKIRSEFNNTSVQATSDYTVINSISNNPNHLYYTVNDDNPVNAAGTDGCHVQDQVTSLYAVDRTLTGEVMLTTTSCGNNLGTGAAISPGKGGNAAIFQGQIGGTPAAITQNVVTLYGNFYVQNLLGGLTHMNWNIAFADNSGNLYDLGLYGPCVPAQTGCPLAVHLGATAGTSFASGTGLQGTTLIPTVAIILPGNYYIAATTNCASTCATLATGPAQMQIVSGNSATASSGGVLPATITIPAQSITTASLPQTGIH
jgi:hypothetical protein